MYAAAVFDLDGTILDTLDDLQLALNHTLDAHGFPPYTRAEVRAMVGNGLRRLMADACPEGTPQAEVDAVFEDFCAYYADHCNDHTRPYAGVVAMVGRLRAAGVRCAVVSNKGDFAVCELMDLHFPGVLFRRTRTVPKVMLSGLRRSTWRVRRRWLWQSAFAQGRRRYMKVRDVRNRARQRTEASGQ